MRSIAYIGAPGGTGLVRRRPRIVNVYTAASSDPAVPAAGEGWTARRPGDVFLAATSANGGTEPSLSVGARLNGCSVNAAVSSAIWMFTAAEIAAAWTNAGHHRTLWHLRDVGAVITNAVVETDNDVDMTWPSLLLPSASIVGGHLVTETAQADIAAALGLGAGWTSRVAAGSPRTRWTFDTGGAVPSSEGSPAETLLTAFAPAPDEFGTATRYACITWAAEGLAE